MNAKLLTIYNSIDDWCNRNRIMYDIVCDERDVQAIMLQKSDSSKLRSLVEHVKPIAMNNGIHVGVQRVRGGTIIAFSLDALSEQQVVAMGEGIMDQNLPSKLNMLFSTPSTTNREPVRKPMSIESELQKSARQMYESQHRHPTNAFSRSNSGSQRSRSSITRKPGKKTSNTSDNTVQSTNEPSQSSNTPAMGATKGLRKENFQNKLNSILEFEQPTLSGLGSQYQPNDIFQRFARALDFLGRQMAIGPIQGLLKQQGINWKKSDDGQSIVFFVTNAETNAPQPIARVGYQTLTKPQEFQKQLLSMVDFAKGQAPGTEQQKYDEAQQAQKNVRDVANQFAPQDPSKQQNQNQGMQPVVGVDPSMTPKPMLQVQQGAAPVAPKPTAPVAKPAAPPIKPAAPVAKSAGPKK